jgi:hypothetical protein
MQVQVWPACLTSDILQDRITSDGRLITDPQNRLDADSAQSSTDPATVGLKRPAGVPATAPATDPISNSQLAEMVDFVTGCKRLLVLTGAGCSTESNIPDYRGPKGAYSTGFQPMTHQQVLLSIYMVQQHMPHEIHAFLLKASARPVNLHAYLHTHTRVNSLPHMVPVTLASNT